MLSATLIPPETLVPQKTFWLQFYNWTSGTQCHFCKMFIYNVFYCIDNSEVIWIPLFNFKQDHLNLKCYKAAKFKRKKI